MARTARYIFKVCKATALSIGTPEVPAKFGSKRSTLGPTLKNESCGMGLSAQYDFRNSLQRLPEVVATTSGSRSLLKMGVMDTHFWKTPTSRTRSLPRMGASNGGTHFRKSLFFSTTSGSRCNDFQNSFTSKNGCIEWRQQLPEVVVFFNDFRKSLQRLPEVVTTSRSRCMGQPLPEVVVTTSRSRCNDFQKSFTSKNGRNIYNLCGICN